MHTTKKSPLSRIAACMLAMMLTVLFFPREGFLFASAADAFSNYKVELKWQQDNGALEQAPCNGAEIKLTNTEDRTKTATATVAGGTAMFENFVEPGGIYEVSVQNLVGYELKEETPSFLANEADDAYTLLLDRLVEIQIRGTVKLDGHPEGGARVVASGYNEVEVYTGGDGRYFMTVYKGKTYTFRAFKDDKYESKPKSVVVNDDQQNDLDLMIKQFHMSVTLNDDALGYIESPRDATVNYGDAFELKLKANEGYMISSVLINNEPVGDLADAADSYERKLNDIKQDTDIAVTFEKKVYTISFTVGENGTVVYDDGAENEVAGGEVDVKKKWFAPAAGEEATRVTISAKPSENYRVSKLTIDDDAKEFTDNDKSTETELVMDKSHRYEVQFSPNHFQVSASVNDGKLGSVAFNNGKTEDDINYGESFSLRIKPADGCYVEDVLEYVNDGEAVSVKADLDEDTVLTVEGVKDNYRFEVVFAESEKVDTSKYTEAELLENEYYSIKFSAAAVKSYIENGRQVYVLEHDAKATITAADGYSLRTVDNDRFGHFGRKDFEIYSTREINKIQLFPVDENGKQSRDMELGVNLKFLIDQSAPEISEIQDTAWTNSTKVTVSGKASDPDYNSSGLSHVVYSKTKLSNADVAAATAKAYVGADGSFTFTASLGEEETSCTYYVYAVDFAKNVSGAKTVKVKVDATIPEITSIQFTSDNGSGIFYYEFSTMTPANMHVHVGVSDGGTSSGLKEMTMYLDGVVKDTVQIQNGSAMFALTEDVFRDGHTIQFVAFDYAGNPSKKTGPADVDPAKSNNVRIATSDPKTDISLVASPVHTDGDKRWYASDTSLAVHVEDGGVGIAEVHISISGEELEADMNEVKINDTAAYTAAQTGSLDFVINTSQVAKRGDGEYTVKVSVVNTVNVTETCEETIYIDRTSPIITGFEVRKADPNAVEKLVNLLTFGMFWKDKAEIAVTASDVDPSSGIQSISLYLNDMLYKTGKVEGNSYVFTVPEDEVAENLLAFDNTLSVLAKDNVGNVSEKRYAPSEVNSAIKNDNLMIETIRPVISVLCDPPADDRNPATKDDNDWYNDDVEFTINIKDADAGIALVGVYMNNEQIMQDMDGVKINENFSERDEKLTNITFTVNTSQAKQNEDGSYELIVKVLDNAGNESEQYHKTVYKDTSAPSIKSIRFASMNNEENQPLNVESTNYGYFFKEDTLVTVSAEDPAPSSGIKSISYYMVDKDNGQETSTVTANVNENGEITFTVKANFKGQIFTSVEDNVGNKPEKYMTPDGVILENENRHSEEEHIFFTLPDTTFRTSEDNVLYNQDVNVDVTVKDTYSGIRRIEWSVNAPYDTGNNYTGTIEINMDGTIADDNESWKISATDANLVTEMKSTLRVTNNSNNIEVWVRLTDAAGNVSEESTKLSIDKTKPVISVSYNDAAAEGSFFRSDRIATITITERNFNSDDVDYSCTNSSGNAPGLSNWNTSVNDADPDKTTHTATITFHNDGDYAFSMKFHDRASNEAEPLSEQSFTIDQTVPTVTVVYDNNSVQNESYYNKGRTATITVVEHNFDKNRVRVVGSASDNGAFVTFPTLSKWTEGSGDTYVAKLVYTDDAAYSFDIECSDMAGNSIADFATQKFTIDKQAPKLEITGVGNKSANKGEVAPLIKVSDTNFKADTVSITLSGANNGVVKYNYTEEEIANGKQFTFDDFAHTKAVDDIYTLKVSLTDYAGNPSTSVIRFSANRFGSVYDMSEVADLIGKYLKEETDIVVSEINVDNLKDSATLIKLTKNGTPMDLKEGTDYSVELTGGEKEWKRYTYILDKKLFEEDGRYSVSFYSEDAAGNINENIDESKDAEISFGVDKTEPVIVPMDLESKKQYALEKKDATLEIKDNLVLDHVMIYLDDQAISYHNENEIYTLEIPESNTLRNLTIVATDAAGNEHTMTVENFLVSTNLAVRWFNNKPLFIGSLSGAGLLIIGVIAFLLFGLKRRRD